MTISNWDEAKRKIKTRSPAFLITAGIILLISSFIAFWNGSIDYRMQHNQTGWTVTTATVNFVDTKIEHSKGKNYGHKYTYYDIYYEYTVNGQLYTGRIDEQNRRKNIGDSLEIKYNPIAPEESTHILAPSKSFIVSGSVFAVLGVALVAFSLYLAKKNPV